jgi:hypothetical protein
VSLARTADLDALSDVPFPCRRYLWRQPDGATVLVEIKRLGWRHGRRVAYVTCHHGGQSWTAHLDVPFRPSLTPHHWTPDDLETR